MDCRLSLLLALVFIFLALALAESKDSSSVQNFDTQGRTSRSAECLRGIDGECQPLIRETAEVKRQTNCNRAKNPHCRIIGGRKRDKIPESSPNSKLNALDCFSPEKGTSVLCKLIAYRQATISQTCEPGECGNPVLKRKDGKDKEKEEQCDLSNPLCYNTFPGKRIGKEDGKLALTARTLKTSNGENGSGGNETPLELKRRDMKPDKPDKPKKRDCNPKRADYFCRYRVPGKRSKIIESTVKELLNRKWRAI